MSWLSTHFWKRWKLMHANLCLQDICYQRAAEPVADAAVYWVDVGEAMLFPLFESQNFPLHA